MKTPLACSSIPPSGPYQVPLTHLPHYQDSAKYDAIHNAHLGLKGLDELYTNAKKLADVVRRFFFEAVQVEMCKMHTASSTPSILSLHHTFLSLGSPLKLSYVYNAPDPPPQVIANEYGLEPPSRLSIGSKVCKELVGKLLCDMANMREESLVTCCPEDDGEREAIDSDSLFIVTVFDNFIGP